MSSLHRQLHGPFRAGHARSFLYWLRLRLYCRAHALVCLFGLRSSVHCLHLEEARRTDRRKDGTSSNSCTTNSTASGLLGSIVRLDAFREVVGCRCADAEALALEEVVRVRCLVLTRCRSLACGFQLAIVPNHPRETHCCPSAGQCGILLRA